MAYPIANRAEWYGEANYEANGGIIVEMNPQLFLDNVRPLELDEASLDNIEDLRCHVEAGRTLDPLCVYDGGREDGRHRAHVALAMGWEKVPVILFGDQILRFEDIMRAQDPAPSF